MQHVVNEPWRVMLDSGEVREVSVAMRYSDEHVARHVLASATDASPVLAVMRLAVCCSWDVREIIPPHGRSSAELERERCATACRDLGDGVVNDAADYAEACYDCEATILEQRPVYRPRTPRADALPAENERMREVLTTCVRTLGPSSDLWAMRLVGLIDGVLYPRVETLQEPTVGWDANGSEVRDG